MVELTELVAIRGGGDIATGVIQKFVRSGIKIIVLEIEKPLAIRRSVALCEAVYEGRTAIEDICGERIADLSELDDCVRRGSIPILIDPEGASIAHLKPAAVIDATLAKRNLGTRKDMAPVTIALGPGFHAGTDVHAVIETMRGHDLGRLIVQGSALPDTGMPGEVGGESDQRVAHAPVEGEMCHIRCIGDVVDAGEAICRVSDTVVTAPFRGLLRGLLHDGLQVQVGMKIADIDPRLDVDWRTISDKARCLGGAALEAYFYLRRSTLA
ncbi:MAG: EF2563 family selenium-dependent molybdenum hydroxylase system protein [Peptococcaceae bacterium]|jgi:xanthine dehydrogenase accessory factor|nr:EF2563 family selenium-dependent molybdenum hydroxylase system protein [Peptococcaceae bacterium]